MRHIIWIRPQFSKLPHPERSAAMILKERNTTHQCPPSHTPIIIHCPSRSGFLDESPVNHLPSRRPSLVPRVSRHLEVEAAALRETFLVSTAAEELRMVWEEHSQITRPAGRPFPQKYVESVSFTKNLIL